MKQKVAGSIYDGDYGLFKVYEDIYCLLGLKCESENDMNIYCVPQSWMVSTRPNWLVKNRKPIYIQTIIALPIETYNNILNEKSTD